MSRPAVIMMVAILGLVWGGFALAVIVGIRQERRKQLEDKGKPEINQNQGGD